MKLPLTREYVDMLGRHMKECRGDDMRAITFSLEASEKLISQARLAITLSERLEAWEQINSNTQKELELSREHNKALRIELEELKIKHDELTKDKEGI